MGKPYAKEMDSIPENFSWAAKTNILPVTRFVEESLGCPLIAIGSGGSFSCAHFAATLHECSQSLAKAVTPMELMANLDCARRSAYLLCSARGRNVDIILAIKALLNKEPRHLAVLTNVSESLLGKLARTYTHSHCWETNIPAGRDGFLATNSLITSATVLARAYAETHGFHKTFPTSVNELFGIEEPWTQYIENMEAELQPLWNKPNLVVIYSPLLKSAAVDLESRFTEAGLGTSQIADFRQFAHGRHHWLAKHGDETSILALVAADDAKIMNSTFALLPSYIPRKTLTIPSTTPHGPLSALITTILIAGFCGRARRLDPGRPGVPSFGRKIYHLRWKPASIKFDSNTRSLAIDRKRSSLSALSRSEHDDPWWEQRLCAFLDRLGKVQFKALVLDYDGTICDESERFVGPKTKITAYISKLLKSQIPVVIATGRGKSVREALRKSIKSDLWNKLFIGYYNGGQIGALSDNLVPQKGLASHTMEQAASLLIGDPILAKVSQIDVRGEQITICPKSNVRPNELCALVMQIIFPLAKHLTVSTSTHSLDVIPSEVSKLLTVSWLGSSNYISANDSVLCIGDQGKWPGNDAGLLSLPHSLSVDEVSHSPDTCWNVAPAGVRGSIALLHYFEAMKLRKGHFRVDPGELV